MSNKNEMEEVFEIILSSPGMDVNVKLDGRITCRTALFLALSIDFAIAGGAADNPLKKVLTEADLDALREFSEQVLERAKLQSFYGKLKKFS